MTSDLKCPSWGRNLVIFSLIIVDLVILLPVLEQKLQKAEAEFDVREDFNEELAIIQGNSLLPITTLANPEPELVRRIGVIVTAYSSTEDQTDSDPFITAAGTWVRDGIIANNYFSFGTKIRIPQIFGDKVFVVEDRMSWTKGNYHVDVWFSSYWEALNFGAKRTYIEILEG